MLTRTTITLPGIQGFGIELSRSGLRIASGQVEGAPVGGGLVKTRADRDYPVFVRVFLVQGEAGPFIQSARIVMDGSPWPESAERILAKLARITIPAGSSDPKTWDGEILELSGEES
jgi:hypothetical protein